MYLQMSNTYNATHDPFSRVTFHSLHVKEAKPTMNNIEMRKVQSVDTWIAVLVLGSLWGFSEVVLGGAMGAARFPYRAAVLTGIAMGLMAVAIAMFRKPLLLVGIPAIAILCKQLVVPILHVSVMCKANSCLAVLVEGLALAGTVTLAGSALHRNGLARIASGASAALFAAAAFHFLGLRLAPCQYLLSFNRPGGLLAFLAAEGVPWAVFSAMLFPVGYRLGEWLKDTVLTLRTRRPFLYYATNAALVAGCWLASAVAIAGGL